MKYRRRRYQQQPFWLVACQVFAYVAGFVIAFWTLSHLIEFTATH